MQYLLLIYADESKSPKPPEDPAEMQKWMEPWMVYSENMKKAGVYLGGDALAPTATATTIAAPGNTEPVFTDGPFAETSEQLGGYYLLECKNLDEALAWGAKCPVVNYGKLEVRPVMTFG